MSNSIKLQCYMGCGALIRRRETRKNSFVGVIKLRDRPRCAPVLVGSRNLLATNEPMFQEVSSRPSKLVRDRNEREEEEELLEREIGSIIAELERAVGRITEMEMGKFLGRGNDEEATRIEAKKMSKRIVGSFLEKPIAYLTGRGGNLEEKTCDLRLLVRMLESSCSTS